MKKTPIAAALLGLSSLSAASAVTLDLYVDSTTQQIYAEPGPNRVKLGTFVKVEEGAAAAPAAAPVVAQAPPAPAAKPAASEKKMV